MPASSPPSLFVISEFSRCRDHGSVARSIVGDENVSAFATASRAAFKTGAGNESDHFSGINDVVIMKWGRLHHDFRIWHGKTYTYAMYAYDHMMVEDTKRCQVR